MEKILEATDLCKTFSNGSVQQHVLKNLNINIYKGDFTIIMGSSGSGKSTLLYGLSGMDRPTLGSIKYENEEISKYSNNKLALFRRKHCGFVFQHNYLNDSMTVMDNILVTGLLNRCLNTVSILRRVYLILLSIYPFHKKFEKKHQK